MPYVFKFKFDGTTLYNVAWNIYRGRPPVLESLTPFTSTETKHANTWHVGPTNIYFTNHLTCALMVLCGERPISAKILADQQKTKLYNIELYKSLFPLVRDADIQERYKGVAARRSRRTHKINKFGKPIQLVQSPRELSGALPPEEQNAYEKLDLNLPMGDGIKLIDRAVLDARDLEEEKLKVWRLTHPAPVGKRIRKIDRLSAEEMYEYYTTHEPDHKVIQYIDFLAGCGFTIGFCDGTNLAKNFVLKYPALAGVRPDGVSSAWAWQTNETVTVYGGEITVLIPEERLAKELFEKLTAGARHAALGNEGVIRPVLPQFFSEMENV